VAAVRRVAISASIRLDRPAELGAFIEPPDGAAAVVTTMAVEGQKQALWRTLEVDQLE
jgi:hypothetical protein